MSVPEKKRSSSKRQPPNAPERRQPLEFPNEKPQPGETKGDYDNYRESS